MKKLIHIPVFLLLLISTVFAQPSAKIKGSVVDKKGNPVKSAVVIAHDTSENDAMSYSHIWQMATGVNGNFEFNVSLGCYDVFVSATLFIPSAARVCPEPGADAVFTIKLKKDPHLRMRID